MKRSSARAVALTLGLAVAVSVTACSGPSAPDEPVTTLKMNSSGLPTTWDPMNSFPIQWEQQAVYETLIYLDSTTYEWKPLLAETFEIGDDLRSMTIKLREDVDFTDGTHLDAAGVKTSFEYAMSPETFYHTVLTTQYQPQLTVTGDYELEVTTTRPMTSEFLYVFGLVSIASPTVIENDPASLAETPVGTGPYVLAERVPEQSMTFERNPEYRDPETFPFDELDFTYFADTVAVQNALKTGQLNAATIDPSHAAEVKAAGFSVTTAAPSRHGLMFPDSTFASAPELADVRVRQAIAYAFDREGINENLEFGLGTVTTLTWDKGSAYYIEGQEDAYAYDPERARELLAEAGFENGFELKMPSGPLYAKYEPIVSQSLADIGITVVYDQTYPDALAYYTAINSGDYGLAFRYVGGLDQNAVFRIDLPNGGYLELNALYEIIDNGSADAVRAAEQAVGRYLLDAVPVIVVTAPPSTILATDPEFVVDGDFIVEGGFIPLSTIRPVG